MYGAPPMVLEPEEHPAVPARAGDGAGDGGQRLVGPPLPVETVGGDGDDVLDTLPFADQPRADDGHLVGADAALFAVTAVELFAKGFQPFHRFRLQAAIGQLLDAVGQSALEVATVERRRLAVEQVAPLLLQVWRRCCLERGQAGGNGILFGHAFLR
jgi:hypothetical protein